MVGDLNVAHEEPDLAKPRTNRNKTPGFCDGERDNFGLLLHDDGFIDTWRESNPTVQCFSYWVRWRRFVACWCRCGVTSPVCSHIVSPAATRTLAGAWTTAWRRQTYKTASRKRSYVGTFAVATMRQWVWCWPPSLPVASSAREHSWVSSSESTALAVYCCLATLHLTHISREPESRWLRWVSHPWLVPVSVGTRHV